MEANCRTQLNMLARIARDEGGMQITEWTAMGAVLLTLVAAVYGVLNGNGQLRAAINGTVGRYAVTFGQDVVARGANNPPEPGSVIAFTGVEGSALVGLGAKVPNPTDSRVIVNINDGSYIVISPADGIESEIRPVDSLRATVDSSSGMIMLSDPLQQKPNVALNPLNGMAVVSDPVTGVQQTVSVAELQQMGIVAIAAQRQAGWPWRVTAPVIAVPQLIGGWL